MANYVCTQPEEYSKGTAGESVLVSLADIARDLVPRAGDEKEVFRFRVTAKFAGHFEVQPDDSVKPFVGDAVDVDDPSKLRPFLMSAKELSPEDRETASANVHLRRGQERPKHPQNLPTGLGIVIESRGVDENNHSFIESELIRELDPGPS